MSKVISTLPTSRRKYLSQSELAQFANITVDDATEADDRISQAEEIVDAYVGFADKFIPQEIIGKISSVASSTRFILQSDQVNATEKDFYKWCEVEIISGTGEGQRRTISTSALDGTIDVTDAFTTTPDATSYYKIYQLGKFPRCEDVKFYNFVSPAIYLKSIPEAVKRAVAAQVEYVISMGDTYFASDKTDKTSESIGDYSYSKGGQGQTISTGLKSMIAPKARLLLKHYINRVGSL